MHRLPTRIVALMIGTLLVVLIAVSGSMIWMSRTLDAQARDQSLAQVRTARANLLTQVRLTTLDYTKWETAVDAVRAKDSDWLYLNIGAAATVGQVVQLVLIWGGPFASDIGWTDDGVEAGRTSLLDPATLGLIEHRVGATPIRSFESADFFVWHSGGVFALGAARFEVVKGENGVRIPDRQAARLAMGRRITPQSLATIEDNYLLTGLEIVHAAPEGRPNLPLLGGDGRPVAYLTWDAPTPGTALLGRMLPWLGLLAMTVLAMAGVGIVLVRRTAQHLVTAERSASTAARTDAMTGLPNRAAFNEALARPARAGERAILFLDVNDFKRINDSIGHAAGDHIVVHVARRLAKLSSPERFLARIAGDEYVFVVTGPSAEFRVRWLAHAAEQVLANPFKVQGHQVQVTMAMGYAVQAVDDMTGADLVRQADLAMYEAKSHKGSGPVAFGAVIEQASRDAAVIEQNLRRALEHGTEITVAYQPIVGPDGRLVRAEALARWTSAQLGPITPDRFVAVAEQAGLMVQLGRRLFQIICDDLVAYPDLHVSINISPLQLMAPDFIPMITEELRDRGIAASRIEIELTESVVVDDPRLAADRLAELHATGFSTALDDFGTGYSSIGYLGQLRFDTLKIDRSFVSKIRSSQEGVEIVRGMIIMARGLRMKVVCEGIEAAEELELLRAMGCDFAQGFHLGRPAPVQVLVNTWLCSTSPQAAVA
ncbi:putative bifunctional diguanylate cyclase/phosphodiesterase [Rubellimicrobium rubrum]|nr:bifunctional diguanylate cyclase/phosphodiesterase [Rubellimicrobium rubrum]